MIMPLRSRVFHAIKCNILLMLALAFLLAIAGCGESEPVVKVDLDKRQSVTAVAQTDAYTYAYLPQYSHTTSYERHRQLLDYLRNETGLPLRQIFPDTFDEHIKMVERGEIDISFSNPLVYVQIARSGARAFARIVEPSGKPDFKGQIICRADNPIIEKLQDVKGKRWIAVDPDSAGGYLFPLGHFLDNNIERNDFSEIAFAPGPGGKQEKVVLAVYTGAYDIGTIREGTLDVLGTKIDPAKMRVLAETRAYPGWVYASRSGLPEEVVNKISTAMYKLHMDSPHNAAVLKAAGIRGIISAGDNDYDPIRELAAKLGLTTNSNLLENNALGVQE